MKSNKRDIIKIIFDKTILKKFEKEYDTNMVIKIVIIYFCFFLLLLKMRKTLLFVPHFLSYESIRLHDSNKKRWIGFIATAQ